MAPDTAKFMPPVRSAAPQALLKLLLACTLPWACAGSACAQAAAPLVFTAPGGARQWQAPAGERLVLGRYAEMLDARCMPLRAPVVRVTQRPKYGSLTVHASTAQAGAPAPCRHVKVPVTEVVYRARRAGGLEVVGWEVHFLKGPPTGHRVQAEIRVGPPLAPRHR